jgi:hypothetical protein
MKNTFVYHSREDQDNIKEFWKNGLFIFDANVLLNLYRYEKKTAEDMFGVLEDLQGRIWIPYQVGMEFHRNRLTTIADQTRKFSNVKEAIEKIRKVSRSSIEELKLKRRHALINIENFSDRIENLLREFDKELDKLEEEQQDVTDQDPILERIHTIFDQRIGNPPDQKEIDSIYLDGVNRYKYKRPPGYKDIEKSEKDADLFYYSGVLYKGRYGDLVAWKQIIEHAKANNIENVIFITDDNKEDWWLQVESMGKKTLGPRLELVREIRQEAGVKNFLMYQFQQFLKYAQDYLNIEVSPDAISEVREVTLEQNISPKDNHKSSTEIWQKNRAMDSAIEKIYTQEVDNENGLVTYKKNDSKEPVTVLTIILEKGENLNAVIMNLIPSFSRELSSTDHTEGHAFICLDKIDLSWQVNAQLMNTHFQTLAPKKITITIGAVVLFNNDVLFAKIAERTLF